MTEQLWLGLGVVRRLVQSLSMDLESAKPAVYLPGVLTLSPAAMNHHLEPLRIVFFGLGAVGSNLLICLAELAARDGVSVHFVVFTIDPAGAGEALYHAERFFDRIEFVGQADFSPLCAGGEPLQEARLLTQSRADAIDRDLVAWDIDLFRGVRDASAE